ncbi:hypothetical protein ColLi_06216 [Colletotrichum liriopes]|uniref:C2H2-type domain-containing protein n=1 Tax=Colletotrichum liriopes TaxID=708192 RepID=A0AA37GNI1_9PEZI|nr:hypothetical protein ColLi_06216 [Colletotrichum liriopes]
MSTEYPELYEQEVQRMRGTDQYLPPHEGYPPINPFDIYNTAGQSLEDRHAIQRREEYDPHTNIAQPPPGDPFTNTANAYTDPGNYCVPYSGNQSARYQVTIHSDSASFYGVAALPEHGRFFQHQGAAAGDYSQNQRPQGVPEGLTGMECPEYDAAAEDPNLASNPLNRRVPNHLMGSFLLSQRYRNAPTPQIAPAATNASVTPATYLNPAPPNPMAPFASPSHVVPPGFAIPSELTTLPVNLPSVGGNNRDADAEGEDEEEEYYTESANNEADDEEEEEEDEDEDEDEEDTRGLARVRALRLAPGLPFTNDDGKSRWPCNQCGRNWSRKDETRTHLRKEHYPVQYPNGFVYKKGLEQARMDCP